jgi:hypothetical protein
MYATKRGFRAKISSISWTAVQPLGGSLPKKAAAGLRSATAFQEGGP